MFSFPQNTHDLGFFYHNQLGSCQRYEVTIWGADLKAQPSNQNNKLVGNQSSWKENRSWTQEFRSFQNLNKNKILKTTY